MEKKFKNRALLCQSIDRLSMNMANFNEVLSIIGIAFCLVVGIAGAHESEGLTLVLLLFIPVLFFNISLWRLIRYICVALCHLLSDSVADKKEEEEKEVK